MVRGAPSPALLTQSDLSPLGRGKDSSSLTLLAMTHTAYSQRAVLT